jgi:hypothetical protein
MWNVQGHANPYFLLEDICDVIIENVYPRKIVIIQWDCEAFLF